MNNLQNSVISGLELGGALAFFPARTFPTIHPVHWLTSHFAVGGFSPLRRLSGMLTAHMTQIAPHNGFTWHPHRGLEIYTVVVEGALYHEDTTGGRGTIHAGEVQRMFSGDFIQHQELNRGNEFTRVIQIWFAAGLQYRGLPLAAMATRKVGDATVRDIVGPGGATESHVSARLTSSTIAANGSAVVEPPQSGEDLFLYVVDGAGSVELHGRRQALDLYDVLMARPSAPMPTVHADAEPLNFLSFYLPTFWPTP
jgi:redox-sensitive bicupin YhaK (pirin superfamily)